jgi:RimJ/RimL family protein N-acetyltransferase
MPNDKTYLFQSERLGLREWQITDIPQMAAINADPDVMNFFPNTQTHQQTVEFIERMQKLFARKGFCYFAVDTLGNGAFIGFIGCSEQTFESDFTPCTDIGWRLSKRVWGNGYATEGAIKCLDYAFGQLKQKKINAIAPKINLRSEQVMIKIGMKKVGDFKHPLLINNERLQECVLYEITQ